MLIEVHIIYIQSEKKYFTLVTAINFIIKLTNFLSWMPYLVFVNNRVCACRCCVMVIISVITDFGL